MLTVSLVCGIVMPRTTSYALNENIQLKYLGYFHDIPLYLVISLVISMISFPTVIFRNYPLEQKLLIEFNFNFSSKLTQFVICIDFELVILCMLGPNVTSFSYGWTKSYCISWLQSCCFQRNSITTSLLRPITC